MSLYTLLHSAHLFFSLPWGQGLHSAQLPFSLPWGQALQFAHLLFTLPWGQGLHTAHRYFSFPCGHRFTPMTRGRIFQLALATAHDDVLSQKEEGSRSFVVTAFSFVPRKARPRVIFF